MVPQSPRQSPNGAHDVQMRMSELQGQCSSLYLDNNRHNIETLFPSLSLSRQPPEIRKFSTELNTITSCTRYSLMTRNHQKGTKILVLGDGVYLGGVMVRIFCVAETERTMVSLYLGLVGVRSCTQSMYVHPSRSMKQDNLALNPQ